MTASPVTMPKGSLPWNGVFRLARRIARTSSSARGTRSGDIAFTKVSTLPRPPSCWPEGRSSFEVAAREPVIGVGHRLLAAVLRTDGRALPAITRHGLVVREREILALARVEEFLAARDDPELGDDEEVGGEDRERIGDVV